MDPDDESCQPKLRRQLEDVDYVSAEFETRQLSWQDVAGYRVSLSLSLCMRACVCFRRSTTISFFVNLVQTHNSLFCDYLFDQ